MATTPFAKIDPARLRDVFYFVKRWLVIGWKWLTGAGSVAFVLALGASVLLYANLEKLATEAAGRQGTSIAKDTTRQAAAEPAAQGATQTPPVKSDTVGRGSDTSVTAAGNTVPVKRANIFEVDPADIQKQQDTFYQQRIGNAFPAWVRNLYFFAGFMLVFGLYEFKKQQQVRKNQKRDQDPKELEALFRYFTGPVIRNLSTPRKLKRFSNKVRLQYKLIEQRAAQGRGNLLRRDAVPLVVDGVTTAVRRDALWFFFLMMLVEFNRRTTLLSGPEFVAALPKLIESGTAGMDENSREIIRAYAARDLSQDPIVAALYELNRNSLI
jgi:hypothetical protein